MDASSLKLASTAAIPVSSPFHDAGFRRRTGYGLLGWLIFCVLAVILHGVQWDETYEHAQVLLGQVPYPAGHPLFQYVRGAYSLQTYLSAALLWLGAGPEWICGFRNVLGLVSTVIPVFLFGALISGRTFGGHIAVVLALRGIHLELDGSYPLTVWPIVFSNGMVGTGAALITLFLILIGWRRSGYLLAGLMPCIHIGQFPPVLFILLLDVVHAWWKNGFKRIRIPLVWLAVGWGCSLGLLILPVVLHVAPPTTGAYAVDISSAQALWKSYTAHYDGHRQFPPRNGQLALVGLLILSGVGMLRGWLGKKSPHNAYLAGGGVSGAAGGLFFYTLGIALLVWGTQLIHILAGPDIPFLFIGWMPYRLINHATLLLLAATVGFLMRSCNGSLLLVAGLVVAALPIPLVETWVGTSLTERYFANGEGILFVLYGAALNGLIPSGLGTGLWKYIPVVLAVALAGVHRFGGYGYLLGVVISYSATRVIRNPISLTTPILGGLVFLVMGTQLWIQYTQRNPLPLTPLDRILLVQPDKTGMVVARPDEFLLQAKTGHPVLVETATASLMSYMPSLAPVIQQLYSDVYGIRFDTSSSASDKWLQVWQIRSRSEWRTLAQKYGFRYVIAPFGIMLDLPEIATTENGILYGVGQESRKSSHD